MVYDDGPKTVAEMPIQDRTPTQKRSKLIGKRLTITAPKDLAEVFRTIAEIIEEDGAVTCTFERPGPGDPSDPTPRNR